jgi:hypothetical protein
MNQIQTVLDIHSRIATAGFEYQLGKLSDREYGRLLLECQKELLRQQTMEDVQLLSQM